MAALKRRRILLLSLPASNMAVMRSYKSTFRFIDRDGLTVSGGATASGPVPGFGGGPQPPVRPQVYRPSKTIHNKSYRVHIFRYFFCGNKCVFTHYS